MSAPGLTGSGLKDLDGEKEVGNKSSGNQAPAGQAAIPYHSLPTLLGATPRTEGLRMEGIVMGPKSLEEARQNYMRRAARETAIFRRTDLQRIQAATCRLQFYHDRARILNGRVLEISAIERSSAPPGQQLADLSANDGTTAMAEDSDAASPAAVFRPENLPTAMPETLKATREALAASHKAFQEAEAQLRVHKEAFHSDLRRTRAMLVLAPGFVSIIFSVFRCAILQYNGVPPDEMGLHQGAVPCLLFAIFSMPLSLLFVIAVLPTMAHRSCHSLSSEERDFSAFGIWLTAMASRDYAVAMQSNVLLMWASSMALAVFLTG